MPAAPRSGAGPRGYEQELQHGGGGVEAVAVTSRQVAPANLKVGDKVMTAYHAARLCPGWVVGREAVAAFIGRSERTVSRWVAQHEFPAFPGPDGRLWTHPGMVDAWILARYRRQEASA